MRGFCQGGCGGNGQGGEANQRERGRAFLLGAARAECGSERAERQRRVACMGECRADVLHHAGARVAADDRGSLVGCGFARSSRIRVGSQWYGPVVARVRHRVRGAGKRRVNVRPEMNVPPINNKALAEGRRRDQRWSARACGTFTRGTKTGDAALCFAFCRLFVFWRSSWLVLSWTSPRTQSPSESEPTGHSVLPHGRAERTAAADAFANGVHLGFSLRSIDVGFPACWFGQ